MINNNKKNYLIGVGAVLISLAATGCDTTKTGDATTTTAPAASAATKPAAAAAAPSTTVAPVGANPAADAYREKLKKDGVEPGKR